MHHGRKSCDVTQTHCPHTAGPEGGRRTIFTRYYDGTVLVLLYKKSTVLNKYCQDNEVMYDGTGLGPCVKN